MIVTKTDFEKMIFFSDPDNIGNTETYYKLRIGNEYIDQYGDHKIVPSGASIVIPKLSGMIVCTKEQVRLDGKHIAKFDLRIEHAVNGLFFQAGTQIKPFYSGILWGYIINFSDKDIAFTPDKDVLFDIEFYEISGSAGLPANRDIIWRLGQAIDLGKVKSKERILAFSKAAEKLPHMVTKSELSSYATIGIMVLAMLFAAFFGFISSFLDFFGWLGKTLKT